MSEVDKCVVEKFDKIKNTKSSKRKICKESLKLMMATKKDSQSVRKEGEEDMLLETLSDENSGKYCQEYEKFLSF